MWVKKRTEDWNKLVLIIDEYVMDDESDEVVVSNVYTIINLSIGDIQHIFDQICSFEDYENDRYSLDIAGKEYILSNRMASELLFVVEEVNHTYEYGGVER